jgi:hypothetical protein
MLRAALLLLALLAAPLGAQQQQQPPPQELSHLGLAAVGHVSAFEGVGIARTTDAGFEIGAGIDLGWIGSARNRLLLDATLLNSLVRFRDPENGLHRGPFYDLAASLSIARLLPRFGRVEPYALAGVGVEAVGSTTNDLTVDVLYNANRFALHAGAGALFTISPDGQDGALAEVRGTAAHALDRVSVRVGYVRFIGRRWRPMRRGTGGRD